MRRRLYIGLALAVLAVVAALVVPIPFLRGKPVHLSLDDFSEALVSLSETKTASVYGQPTFHWLKSMHEATGAKFTLYTYARTKKWIIGDVPTGVWEELAADGWIKVGFHASSPESQNEDSAELREAFADFEKAVPPELRATTLRLHYYNAPREAIPFLRAQGVRKLLSAHDDRICYSLPGEANDTLLAAQRLLRDSLEYERTDFRSELSLFPIFDVWSRFRDDKLVVFTHEWALDRWNAAMFRILVGYLALYGCIFIAE